MSRWLRVNTDELRSAGSTFIAVGEALAAVRAGAPLGDAAAAVPGLQTASACTVARNAVSNELTAIATGARTYGSNLSSAAGNYESTDDDSGQAIRQVAVPPAS